MLGAKVRIRRYILHYQRLKTFKDYLTHPWAWGEFYLGRSWGHLVDFGGLLAARGRALKPNLNRRSQGSLLLVVLEYTAAVNFEDLNSALSGQPQYLVQIQSSADQPGYFGQ
jgi:hypothetical protein